MDLQITNFSDDQVKFEIDPDPTGPSLFIRSLDHKSSIRQFLKWEQLETLRDQINEALDKRQPKNPNAGIKPVSPLGRFTGTVAR